MCSIFEKSCYIIVTPLMGAVVAPAHCPWHRQSDRSKFRRQIDITSRVHLLECSLSSQHSILRVCNTKIKILTFLTLSNSGWILRNKSWKRMLNKFARSKAQAFCFEYVRKRKLAFEGKRMGARSRDTNENPTGEVCEQTFTLMRHARQTIQRRRQNRPILLLCHGRT